MSGAVAARIAMYAAAMSSVALSQRSRSARTSICNYHSAHSRDSGLRVLGDRRGEVRQMKKMLTAMLVSAALAGAAGYAYGEKQPHMHEAMKHLEQAKASLDKAEADKGGHRVKALELVSSA